MGKKMKKPLMHRISKGDQRIIKFDPGFWDLPEDSIDTVQPLLLVPNVTRQDVDGGLLREVVVTGKKRRPVVQYESALPSLSKMMAPRSFDEYMQEQFRQILGIPKLQAPHELIAGGFLPTYENGKESDDEDKIYNSPAAEEVVIQPKRRSTYSIPPRAVAQPSDTNILFGNLLTKDLILDDIYTSNPSGLEKYEKEVYKRKKGMDWDLDRGAYYTWLGSKPFLRSKTRREILLDKYRTHVDKLYGKYAQDISDAINYVNGYFSSPEYADRMRGYDINNPVDGVAEGRKFLSQYARNESSAWTYENGDNTFYIPKELPMWEFIYNSQYDPYFAAAHEYAHYMQAKTRGYGNDAFADREKKLFDRRTNVANAHDSRYAENYADLIATRADMYRKGLVKNPYDNVSPEAIKTYREKYGANNRFFNMYGDDDIRAMYNTIAYNPYIKTPNIT